MARGRGDGDGGSGEGEGDTHGGRDDGFDWVRGKVLMRRTEDRAVFLQGIRRMMVDRALV